MKNLSVLRLLALCGCAAIVSAEQPEKRREQGVPSGLVAFFTTAACPPGWSAAKEAQGRLPVGASEPGEVGEVHGDSLGRRESPTHMHPFQAASRFEALDYRLGSVRYLTVLPGTVVPVEEVSGPASLQLPFLQLPACKRDE